MRRFEWIGSEVMKKVVRDSRDVEEEMEPIPESRPLVSLLEMEAASNVEGWGGCGERTMTGITV